MRASEIRKKYLEFFQNKGHREIPPAPLVPPDDPTTLFTSSGMQQLVPYLKGQKHSMGTRLVNSQPSFRAEDIEEVGDNRHTTFFEMLGNWSLGDYFKKEQLFWIYEFFTDVVGLDSKKLFITVFQGEGEINKDKESVKIWQEIFKTNQPAAEGKKGFDPKTKIYSYIDNWWSRSGLPRKMPPGEIGGSDSEVFYDFGIQLNLHEKSKYKDQPCHVNCDCGRFLEIGNSVFMQYEKQKNGTFLTLPKKNVDFGGGLERITAASENTPDIFATDLFQPIIRIIEQYTGNQYQGENQPPMRVIADHLRAATFMFAQGIKPSNKEQGYILRRLLRRSAVKMWQLKGGLTPIPAFEEICEQVLRMFDGIYLNQSLVRNVKDAIISEEMSKFGRSLDKGLKIIERTTEKVIDGKFAFDLFQTYGFPFEITQELLSQKGISINNSNFIKDFIYYRDQHQNKSRTASAGMFKGGLADQEEATTKLHTATHLLHQVLRQVLGEHVRQEGSNITAERLRFDFANPNPLTATELKKIEQLINDVIKQNLPVHKTVEKKEKALNSGALAFFRETYPEQVSVYTVGKDPQKDWLSKELCGGPHVRTTGEIGKVKIIKEKSIGSGIRRIYIEIAV